MWMVFFWAEYDGRAFVIDGKDVTSHAHGLRMAENWMPMMGAHWAEVRFVRV